jgi:hypothetical protein
VKGVGGGWLLIQRIGCTSVVVAKVQTIQSPFHKIEDMFWAIVALRVQIMTLSLKALILHFRLQNIFYAFYNDEHPNGTVSFTRGHTKGVLAFDGNSGFWLIHSVPHFPPPVSEGFSYPHSGRMYGQSALCVQLSASDLNELGKVVFISLYNFMVHVSVCA